MLVRVMTQVRSAALEPPEKSVRRPGSYTSAIRAQTIVNNNEVETRMNHTDALKSGSAARRTSTPASLVRWSIPQHLRAAAIQDRPRSTRPARWSRL